MGWPPAHPQAPPDTVPSTIQIAMITKIRKNDVSRASTGHPASCAELSFSASLVAGLAKLGCEVTLEPAEAAWPSSHQNPVRRMLTPAG